MNELKAFVCPACSWNSHGSNFRQERYPTASDYNSEIPRPHSIYFCNNCGLGIAYPELTESQLDSLYTEGNYWRNLETALSPKKSPGYYALAQARWNIVELFLNDRNKKERISILDIGAGHGFFGMVAAKSKNILIDKYCVVEKEPKFRESLTKTWPIYFPKIKVEIKDSLENVRSEFEVIVLSNILEHLNNPQEILELAIKRLATDGVIFVDTPNSDYLFKKDVFPHLLFFNSKSLEALLRKCCLAIKSISCYGRKIDQSPINSKTNNVLFIISEKIMYKARHVLPLKISSNFFAWFFGASTQNPNGTWIRAIAQKES